MKNKFEKIVVELNPPQMICDVLIFGSTLFRGLDEQSDIDILVIHSSTETQDYRKTMEFIEQLKSFFEKHTHRLVDVFCMHYDSVNFITDSESVYINVGASKAISIFKNYKSKAFFNYDVGDKKRISMILASASILFFEIFHSIPDIDPANRRNNFKKVYWFFEHLKYVGLPVSHILKKIIFRIKNISKEAPAETYTKDAKWLGSVSKYANKAKLFNLDIKSLSRVQFSSFYFIEAKRFYSSLSSSNIDRHSSEVFFRKGLSLMLQFALLYEISEVLRPTKKSKRYCDLLQRLVDKYVNRVNHKYSVKLAKHDFSDLMILFDFTIVNLKI